MFLSTPLSVVRPILHFLSPNKVSNNMSRQSLRSRLSEVYNKCIRSKGGIEDIEVCTGSHKSVSLVMSGSQELSSVIEEAKNSGLKCSELAVCYAMRCDRLLDIGDFDKVCVLPNERTIFPVLVNVGTF